jgi:GTP diphosphokinase / guanosine-3',5'-bis(diphosphate) 3'-diphosphatase
LQINLSTDRGLSPSILHEAVEAAIEQIASQTVARIVVEVTDDKSLPKAERKRCKSSRLFTRVAKQNLLSSLTRPVNSRPSVSANVGLVGRTYVVAQVRGVSPGLGWQFDDASKNAEESVHHQ